jgi:alcohol dehydrogenase class IV
MSACLKSRGGNKIFLLHGSHFETGATVFMKGSVLPCVQYIKKGSNVHTEEVQEVWNLYQASGANAIVAIGGGSVIDLGKMMVWQCLQQKCSLPLLAAAPTTTGSGSEATRFAVLYEHKKKLSISHPSLLPSIVALDPLLVYSQSAYQAAVSGMDVLAQAVESYWSRASVPESRKLASAAIGIWKEHFISGLDSQNQDARKLMQIAANLSGQAIDHTRTTGPHALSYYLTSTYGVAHGQAVAFFLPVFFEYNQPGIDLLRVLGVQTKEEAALMIRERMVQAGLAIHLSAIGIDKNEIIDQLLADVNTERFGNNPVLFDGQVLRALLLKNL